MNFVALKMLTGDRAKYFGIIFGVMLASLLMTHQATIFVGILLRTGSIVSDMTNVDVLVTEPRTEFLDDVKPMSDDQLLRVRGVSGVEWAVPMFKGPIKASLGAGKFRSCIVVGLDDASLVGGPAKMVQGSLADLRQTDGIIVDELDAQNLLASAAAPGAKPAALKVGDTLELNDHRAVVVGISKNSRPFISQPVIYTTYTRATRFAPPERNRMAFVLAKARSGGTDAAALARRIEAQTGMRASTPTQFVSKTVDYYLKNTGIPVNFGTTILLAFIVGAAIAGQTFYLFTLDNLKHFAALKAMGATGAMLLRMTLLQAALVGMIGYGLGLGGAVLFFQSFKGTELDFAIFWQVCALSGGVVMVIVLLAAAISLRKVLRLEPGIVFKG
jgi:putative ABC transport system permease protein